jgi:hypothetical protein
MEQCGIDRGNAGRILRWRMGRHLISPSFLSFQDFEMLLWFVMWQKNSQVELKIP